MEDSEIVELYWRRVESAIGETARKYGGYCRSIARNILADPQDSEECVNDTYLGAWNSMPPHRPTALSTFLGKITRRIAIHRLQERKAEKRGGGEVPLALEELSSVLSAGDVTQEQVELKALTASIDRFLSALPQPERDIFVSRYWFLMPLAEISAAFGFRLSKTKSMLFRTRKKLGEHLREEGFL